MSPTISTFYCPSSTFQNPYFIVHHMISTTHIHISFQLQPEESPSTCDHSLSTCHQPSTITLHLPHFTIHLPPVTFHHSPSIKHHYSPPPPPATFYHTLSTMDLLHPAHLPSTIYQPPPSSMIHFYLLHSTMFLDCSQLTFLSLTFQHLLSSLPSFSPLCDHQILLINNTSWICISF